MNPITKAYDEAVREIARDQAAAEVLIGLPDLPITGALVARGDITLYANGTFDEAMRILEADGWKFNFAGNNSKVLRKDGVDTRIYLRHEAK